MDNNAITLMIGDDGVAREYDSTWDITIHCESEEEQKLALEKIKLLNKKNTAFRVIDNETNKEADVYEISLNEEWAKSLCYTDMDGFAVTDGGNLILLDECGQYSYCPLDRFTVVWE